MHAPVTSDKECHPRDVGLEPLLTSSITTRLKSNLLSNQIRRLIFRSHVVVPVIDVIDDDTMEYLKGDGTPQIGGVSWGLIFTWQSMQKPDRLAWNKNRTIPIK